MVTPLHTLDAPTDNTSIWLQTIVLIMSNIVTKLTFNPVVGLPESLIAYKQQYDSRSLNQCSNRGGCLFYLSFRLSNVHVD